MKNKEELKSWFEDNKLYVGGYVKNKIDQLEEPETIEQTTRLLESVLKENKRLGELLEEKHEEWLELMDKINNQETLKKPTIPEFVAEYLRGKEEDMLYELLHNDFIYDDYNELAKWLYNNDDDTNKEREFSLVLAQRYGYKLEKEQKYFAKIKGHEKIGSDDKYWNYCIADESLDIGDNKVHADVLNEYMLNATKDEWENLGINDDNADFVKVEGEEE